MAPKKIAENVYQVGGSALSHPYDAAVYLLDFGRPTLIDCGLGAGVRNIVENIGKTGVDLRTLGQAILTHCHVDHIGAASLWKGAGLSLIMHELDAQIVERGDNLLTAAFCFNIEFRPLPIDVKLKGEEGTLLLNEQEVSWIHTPGHTPGSISLYLDMDGKRILFAQDIQAPLLKEFDCDPAAWERSVEKLLALEADVLCDGHMGAWKGARRVREYLERAVRSHREESSNI